MILSCQSWTKRFQKNSNQKLRHPKEGELLEYLKIYFFSGEKGLSQYLKKVFVLLSYYRLGNTYFLWLFFSGGFFNLSESIWHLVPFVVYCYRKMVQKTVVTVRIGANVGKLKNEGPPSDFWSWRKYGQKPIKGSPYPRFTLL